MIVRFLKLFALALCVGLAVFSGEILEGSEILLGVDPSFDARGQGFDLNGFASAGTDRDNASVRLRLPASPSKRTSCLRTCYDMLSKVDSKDIAAAEIRFKVAAPAGKNAGPVNAGFRIRWFSGENFEWKFPVVPDGRFHTCRVTFDKIGVRPRKTVGFYCYFYPDPDGKLAGGEFEFQSLRLILSPEGTIRNYTEMAKLRLELLADQLSGLRKFRLEPPGGAAALQTLREKLTALDSAKWTPSEKIAGFKELSREYAALHQTLSGGRRLVNLTLELAALNETFRFRVEKKTPVAPELSRDLRQLENNCRILAERFHRNAATGPELARAEQACRAVWDAALSPEAGELCWQSGVSRESFGLFGWSPGKLDLPAGAASPERMERYYFTNPDGSKSMLKIRPENAGFIGMAPAPSEISWVSRSWCYFYRRNGKKIHWELTGSWLAPGILIDTDAPKTVISPVSGEKGTSLRLAVPTGNGVRLLRSEELAGFHWRDMSENWLLLLAGTANPEVPWLLTLAHRPAAVDVRGGRVILSRPGGIGTIGIASLFGVRPLPSGWSKHWMRLPDEVSTQCRRINAVMTAYPLHCEEFFAVDRKNARVRIENRFRYRKIGNDWNYPGTETAPLPPVLVLAARNGYPAQLPAHFREPGFDTIYGPYAVCDSNRVEYSLPLPDLRGESYLKTERYPARIRNANATVWSYKEMHKNTFSARPHYPAVAWTPILDSWNLLNPGGRKFAEENIRRNLDRYFTAFRKSNNTLEGIYETHLPAERTEPFTGLPYSVMGWTSRSGTRFFWHDITDFAGFVLYGVSLYAQYTGDWGEVRRNWTFLRETYQPLLRRCDWASMAVGTTDNRLVHTIDMAPDTWIASEAMNRMALQMRDRRSADLAGMVAAKEAVPIVGDFLKREWEMSFNNTWDWNSQIPELGYSQYGGIQAARWDNPILSTSMFVGMYFSPALLDLYRATCPKALARFADRMKKHDPQWKNPLYLRKGDKFSLNGPLAFARYMFLYDVLNAPTEDLKELAEIGAMEKGGALWETTSGSTLYLLSNSATALLLGRDAPVRLREWAPARLEQAEYDEKKCMARITFTSPVPFQAGLTSFTVPAKIRINGADINAKEMWYDPSRRKLSLQLKSGVTRLELFYPGWKAPERKRVVPGAGWPPCLTPEMKLCRASRDQFVSGKIPAAGIPDFSGAEIRPLSLDRFFNLRLVAGNSPPPVSWNRERKPVILDEKLQGIPFRVGLDRDCPLAVGMDKRKGRKAEKLTITGAWKRLYFLYALGKTDGMTPPFRCIVDYADGSRSGFPPEKVGENVSGDWFENRFTNRRLRIAVWENREREEISGVVADFQRTLKKVRKIEVEFLAPSGSAVLLAVTGEAETK